MLYRHYTTTTTTTTALPLRAAAIAIATAHVGELLSVQPTVSEGVVKRAVPDEVPPSFDSRVKSFTVVRVPRNAVLATELAKTLFPSLPPGIILSFKVVIFLLFR